jgi:hypothetical protein
MVDSDLEKDFAKEVTDKVRLASELLVEISKLCTDNNLTIDTADLDNLTQVLDELNSRAEWNQSVADTWISSSANC